MKAGLLLGQLWSLGSQGRLRPGVGLDSGALAPGLKPETAGASLALGFTGEGLELGSAAKSGTHFTLLCHVETISP